MVVIAKPLKLKTGSKSQSESSPVKKDVVSKPIMTEAEKSYRAAQRRRIEDKITNNAEPSYREKVQQYNKLLANYSDHFDIKKTSE